MRSISGETVVAGVVGRPVRHSLSPVIHNAWLEAAGLDAVYVAFSPRPERFDRFVGAMTGGVIRGLNVTAPFKEAALALADVATDRARRAGSANLLLFAEDGVISADNTDGEGLLWAFATQAPGFDPTGRPVVILGAGGAARGALSAFLEAGAPRVNLINRDIRRAETLAAQFGDLVRVFEPGSIEALAGAEAVINATPLGSLGSAGPDLAFEHLDAGAVVMDMVYRPLRTDFLRRAADRGLRTVDGLEMLIGQAMPSFSALFGRPPSGLDARSLALSALEG